MRKWLLFDVISQYNVLPNFTAAVARALTDKGYTATIVQAVNAAKVFNELHTLDVDVLLGFNGVQNFVRDGMDVHDRLNILSIAWLVDDPNYHWPRFVNPQSPRFYLACIDRKHVEVARQRDVQAIFLPHAADPQYLTNPMRHRPVDIFVSGSFTSPSKLLHNAREKLSPVLLSIFHDMIETYRYDVSFSDALKRVLRDRSLDMLAPQQFMALEQHLWPWVDRYLRNKARQRAVWTLPKDARIVVSGKGDWDSLTERMPEAILLPPLDFKDTVKLMQQSKIVLNISPFHADGGHERVFYGMVTGAAVLTNSTPFLKEAFRDGENILFLEDNLRDNATRIQSYLRDGPELRSLAEAGQDQVLKAHTWAHRVDQLLQEIGTRGAL